MGKIQIPLITPDGRLIEQRDYVNTPLERLMPNEPIALIQWLMEFRKKPTIRNIEQGRDSLIQDIHYESTKFKGYWAWGSSVKQGFSVGLHRDIGWITKMFRYIEDAQRFTRWMLNQGWYGSEQKRYRIQFLKPGTMTPWGPVADGFGYMSRRIIPENNRPLVKLGNERGSYTFWQRIPWTQPVMDELIPLMKARINRLSDSPKVMLSSSNALELKQELVEAEPEMIEHPLVANSIDSQWSEYLARVATTVPTGGFYKLAVPAMPDVEFIESGIPGSKRYICYRYPIDSYSSIQAVEGEYSSRIEDMEAIQYTLSSLTDMAKGCAAIVDGMNDWDMILCTEDLKMSSRGVPSVTLLDGMMNEEIVLNINQKFEKGCCVGLNMDWYKETQGGDGDGDGEVLVLADGLPATYEAVQNNPKGSSIKLPKNKRLLEHGDLRPEFMEQSMRNLVGFASNVASQCLARKNQLELAIMLGFSTVTDLHDKLNYAIKVGTDGFKANVNPEPVVDMLTLIQSKLGADEVNPAPWTTWGGTGAFKHFIPKVYDNLYVRQAKWYGVDKGVSYELNEEEFNAAVSRQHHTGTIGALCDITLPDLGNLLETGIKHQPLAYYRRWAVNNQELIPMVKPLREWWSIHHSRTNFNVPEQIINLKNGIIDEVEVLIAREGISRFDAANTLWYMIHGSHSEDSSGACVFYAFPEECVQIARLKPGILPYFETMLTGVDYQLKNFESGEFNVEVVEVIILKAGKQYLRKALCAEVYGQKQPQPPYPMNMIGLVAQYAIQPKPGVYKASIKKFSEKAWTCTLVDA
jgi:hypothetical protein